MSGRFLALVLLMPLALGTTDVSTPAGDDPSVPTTSTDGAPAGLGPDCTQSPTHPLDVTVRLLDALTPGRWITAEVVVRSAVPLGRLRLEISGVRDVSVSGSKQVDLGPLPIGQEVRHTLQLRVDDSPKQRQLLVVAEGTAEGMTLRRGATLNLLPRGPHHPGVASAAPGKARDVVEYPGVARRLR